MDAISEERIKLLMPEFAERIRKRNTMLAGEGIYLRTVQGFRTWGDQNFLWEKGRSIPGEPCWHGGRPRPVRQCPIHPLGATVTNAKGGESWHCYAVAEDCCPDDPDQPGFQPDWDSPHWPRIVAVGESVGLRSGKSWRDLPHFEFTGRFGTKPNDEILYLFRDGGMQAVWEEIKKSI